MECAVAGPLEKVSPPKLVMNHSLKQEKKPAPDMCSYSEHSAEKKITRVAVKC